MGKSINGGAVGGVQGASVPPYAPIAKGCGKGVIDNKLGAIKGVIDNTFSPIKGVIDNTLVDEKYFFEKTGELKAKLRGWSDEKSDANLNEARRQSAWALAPVRARAALLYFCGARDCERLAGLGVAKFDHDKRLKLRAKVRELQSALNTLHAALEGGSLDCYSWGEGSAKAKECEHHNRNALACHDYD